MAACARSAVDAITTAVAAAARAFSDPTLGHGHAGLALFLAERERHRAAPVDDTDADSELQIARRQVASAPLSIGLLEGVAGVAWVTAHLAPARAAARNASFERLLVDRLRKPWADSFDLFFGSVGFCVYALERWPDAPAEELLTLCVGHLAAAADETGDGLAWPDWWPLEPQARRGYPLGVAHGTPGVIGALAGALAAGFDDPRLTELLDGAMRFMLARLSDDPAGAGLGKWHFPDGTDLAGKSAWCNGDPGACVTMLAGARALGRVDWEQRILAAALAAAARGPVQARIRDGCLCHGEAGLGHVFHRLFVATGDERFAEAARTWYQRVLARFDPGAPMAGFSSLSGPPRPGSAEPEWHPAPGFIAGAAGTGLALLAACGGPEPEWDRVLLLSQPRA